MQLNNEIIKFSHQNKEYITSLYKPWNIKLNNNDNLGLLIRENNSIDNNILKTKVKNKEFYYVVHLTSQCNMKCNYCFEKNIQKTKTKFCTKDFIEFVKIHKNVKNIRFFGGEPLLKQKEIFEIIDNLSELKIQYNIFTNGLLLNPGLIKKLHLNNVKIFLSLDGTKELHDKNRKDLLGNDTYKRIIKNINPYIQKNSSNIVVRVIINPNEKFNLIKISENLYKEGFKMVSFEFPWESSQSLYSLNKINTKYVIKQLQDYTKELINRIKNKDFSLVIMRQFTKFIPDLLNENFFFEEQACSAGNGLISIKEDGEIYPCHAFIGENKYKIGSLAKGYNQNNLISKNNEINKLEFCSKCPIKYYCTKRCFADALLFTNKVNNFNNFRCEIEKELFKSNLIIYLEIKNSKFLRRAIKFILNKFNYIYSYT